MFARCLILLALLTMAFPAEAGRRVALVVGNGAYEHAAPLKNPAADAKAVSSVLRQLDFEVLTETNLDKHSLERTLKRFARLSAGAEVALFYYSGHALQMDDQNFLLPVSANITGAADMPLETVALQDVANVMQAAGVRTQLVILDACRNNPFAAKLTTGTRSARSAGAGLAAVTTSAGSLVAFSTSPGALALDGDGELSPFTASFAKRALEPRLEIRQTLTKVRNDVIAVTGERQTPWDNSSLREDFYFVPPRQPPVFERLTVAQLLPTEFGGPVPLRLAPPRQPEGGEVRVTIDTLPKAGQLVLAGRPVEVGASLTPGEFAEIAYLPRDSQDPLDPFSYWVLDRWGNKEQGHVAVARVAGGSAATAPPRPADAVALGQVSGMGKSVIGLGPNLRLVQSPSLAGPAVSQQWVKLAAATDGGELMLGERKLDSGKSMQLADLARLAFIPASGSEGKTVEAVFTAEQPASGEVRIQIQVEMHDCDRLAADRLDSQGVAEGVLYGNMEADKAVAACEAAVKAHPDVGRFRHQLGRAYLSKTRLAEAFASFQRAAELGHIRAHVGMGQMHAVGLGVPRDEAKALAEHQRAAQKGDVFGIYALGKILAEGRGVPRDITKGRDLYEQAARLGHTYGMNALGALYAYGIGVEKDPAVARRYWEEAAVRDDLYGIHNLGIAYRDGIGGERDTIKALTFFKQASDRGHPNAPNSIGFVFWKGQDVPQNLAVAAQWYRVGAERGDATAALNLGEMYEAGNGVPRNLVEAAGFYARAAAFYTSVDSAKKGRAGLAALARPGKAEALREIAGRLDPRPLSDRGEPALRQRAAEIAGRHGLSVDPKNLDDALVALAKVEWDGKKARADLF